MAQAKIEPTARSISSPILNRLSMAVAVSFYRKCVVSECKRKRTEPGRFFSFPKKHEDLVRWCSNLNIDVSKALSRKYFVCADHFEPHEYRIRKVNDGAVPTLNLGYKPKETSIIRSEFNQVRRRCGLKYCNNTSKICTIFSFPKNEKLRNVWNKLLNVEYKLTFLCQYHFKPEDIRGKRLAVGAIPSENLPCNYEFKKFVSPTVEAAFAISNTNNTTTVADRHITADGSAINIAPADNVIDAFSVSGSYAGLDASCAGYATAVARTDALVDTAPAGADIRTDMTDVVVGDIKSENSQEFLYLDAGHENKALDGPGSRQFESINVTWLQTKIANFEERLSMLETRLKIIEEKYPI